MTKKQIVEMLKERMELNYELFNDAVASGSSISSDWLGSVMEDIRLLEIITGKRYTIENGKAVIMK